MGLSVSAGSSEAREFERAPEGTHIAVCYSIVDLGIHKTGFTDDHGNEKEAHKIRIAWELHGDGCVMTEGQNAGLPFSASKMYTASLHEKAILRQDLESWRGRAFTDKQLQGFKLNDLLGKPCFITLVHVTKTVEGKERTYVNVKGVMALPKGTSVPELVNAPLLFDLDNYTEQEANGLPEWLRNKINFGDSLPKPVGPQVEDYEEDDIPF